MLKPPSAKKLLSNAKFEWQSDTTAHFIINYERSSPAVERLDRIKRDVEQSFIDIETLLNESYSFADRFQVFVVSSRERMKELIGYETNGVAFPRTEVLCYIVTDKMMLSAKHELFHVMAMNMWGTPDIWLNEGMAVYADDHWHNHELHDLASHLRQSGEFLSLSTLQARFRKHNDLITYPLAGSVAKYLYETYGIAAIKAIWQGQSIEEATGIDRNALEQAWIDQLPEPTLLDYHVR